MKWTRECANIVKDYRAKNRLTQQELAAKTGITQASISDMERGRCQFVRAYNAEALFAIMPELRQIQEKEIETMNEEMDAIKRNHEIEANADVATALRCLADGIIADLLAFDIEADKKVEFFLKINARLEKAGVLVGK